ncbi:hypothetical protein KQX54_008404 [Cotesia glomerata]|uniref:Uncharacterized protein n=1 Tax=Cotesia glomerata TaxID=32391 RepID=A0AAV7HTQ8_COTGL|nr:hypothetical protein KQX54_008404 [Cotesia glomerata]
MIEHYKKILRGSNHNDLEDKETIPEQEVEHRNTIHNEELDEEFTMKKLKDTLTKLKNGKAAGEDGITIKFIKTIPTTRLVELLNMINSIWTRCEMPTETIEHLLICREARMLCTPKIADKIQALTDGKYDADLQFLVKELLRGPPNIEICLLFKVIENKINSPDSDAEKDCRCMGCR